MLDKINLETDFAHILQTLIRLTLPATTVESFLASCEFKQLRNLTLIQGCQIYDKEYGKCLPSLWEIVGKNFVNGNVIGNSDF